jgi:hypothetical protein
MERLIVSSEAFYDLIVHPTFTGVDANFTGNYSGTLGEFTVDNNVSLAKGNAIIDIFSKRNILQRKDRSCKTNWSQIARGSNRKITVDELYGAVEDCQEEFYAGCLKDFRQQSPIFRDFILRFFKQAMATDLASNSYFGDVTRAADSTDTWSWNQYDGVFKKYADYINQGGDLAPVVLSAIPQGTIAPQDAYLFFDEAYKKQTYEMKGQMVGDRAFYVNDALAQALYDYYIIVGINAGNIGYIENGMPALKFKGIPVIVEPTWDPILTLLNSGIQAHALVLTIRGNFIFGTNKSYGGGAELNQALRVWWSEDDEVWRYKMHLAAGTEIASPQNTVLALTDIS